MLTGLKRMMTVVLWLAMLIGGLFGVARLFATPSGNLALAIMTAMLARRLILIKET